MSTAKRVLLVEDDRFLRRACEMSLQQRGFVVITATDGEEGLRLARAERPDVVLLDLLMPKLPGVKVLEALKQDPSTATIPVLILSNSSREDDRRQAAELGVSGYFVKANLSLKELAAHVARLVNASPGTDDMPVAREESIVMTAAQPGLRRPLVLIVDDIEESLTLLRRALAAIDCDIVEARNGQEAMTIAASATPDLVVLDILIPPPNGLDVCERLKKLPRSQRPIVVVMTGLTHPANVARARKVGADAVFDKPLDFAQLVATVRELLEARKVGVSRG